MARTANRLRNVGRPPIISPEIIETICQSIRAGNYLEPSAALAGVSTRVCYNWIKRGRAEIDRISKSKRAKVRERERLYVDFVRAIKESDAMAEARDVATISLAAEKQWQAAAWRLERKHNDRWGRRNTVHEGEANPTPASIIQYPINPRDEVELEGDGETEPEIE